MVARSAILRGGLQRDLPGTLRLNRGNLTAWRAALAAVRAGTRDAKILCVGDSTTHGYGNSTTSCYPLDSWPSKLVDALQAAGIPAARGLAVPLADGSPSVDSRWSYGAGWTTNMYGFGNKGCARQGANVTTPLIFADSGVMADRFDVYCIYVSGSVASTIQATGGSAVTTAPNNPLRIVKLTCSAGSAATSNVLTITPTAAGGENNYVAVEPWLSSVRKVRVANAGVSGSKVVAGWDTGATSGIQGHAAIYAYAPDLTLIDLGINDGGLNTADSTYLASMSAVAATAALSGSVIFKTMLPSDPATGTYAAKEALYVATLRANTTRPIIDYYSRKTFAQNNAAGYMYDLLHGTSTGYADAASFVSNCLLPVSA